MNKEIKQRLTLYFFIVLFGTIYTLQVVMNHYLMRTYALDYGYYNQAFWDFAHFRSNYNTVYVPVINYFQVHPGFTLFLLSPLYHIFNPLFGTYSLLIIQNIFILIGGYSVYLLIFRKTGNFWIALLAFIHFNVIWGHYSALSADFIETTIGASTVPLFILLFDKKKYFAASAVFLFIQLCKENMPIWLFFISVWLILTYRESTPKWIAAAYGIFSVLYFILLFGIVIPYFSDENKPYWSFAYSALGANPQEALSFIIRNPVESFRMLFVNHLNDPAYNNIKKEFYLVFLWSGGILLFIRPWYFIPFIPVIAQKMFNDSFGKWGILGFYSIEVVSILTLLSFLIIIRFRNPWIKYLLCAGLCLTTFITTLKKMEHRESFWYDRSKEAIYSREFFHSDLDAKEIRKLIRQTVPDTASLVCTQGLVPHFSQRNRISYFPYVRDYEYIALLKTGSTWPLEQAVYNEQINIYKSSNEWSVIVDSKDLIIFRRKPILQ